MITPYINNLRHGRLLTAVLALGFGLVQTSLAQALNPCDLDANGSITSADVDLAARMAVGSVPCSANVVAAGVCNPVLVMRVSNAMITGTCVTGVARKVVLNWTASTSQGVVGYKVYRSTTQGGPYTLLTSAPVAAVTFTDEIVQGSLTYYYVVIAVDSSGNASPNSNEAIAVVPNG